ncbi:MAG: DUF6020 family protein [Eubacteriales bacterium]|nr:DUF6020 family protein [Eubacteriales bacterium]
MIDHRAEFNSGRSVHFLLLLCSAAAASALIMTFRCKTFELEYLSVPAEIFDNLYRSFKGKSLTATILTAAVFYLAEQRFDRKLVCRPAFMLFSGFLSAIWLMAEGFRIDNTLDSLSLTSGQVCKSVIYFIGIFFLSYEMTASFCYLLEKSASQTLAASKGKFCNLSKRSRFIIITTSLLLIWYYPVVAAYPAILGNDQWTQLAQYWGVIPFTTHHPPAHTFLIGICTQIGLMLGNVNRGLFAYVLVQVVLYALTVSYSFEILHRLKAPAWLKGLYYVSVALSPFYSNRVGACSKDNIFSLSVLLFIIELIYAMLDPDEFAGKKSHRILATLSIIGVLLMRNNGRYILYPTLAVIATLLFKYRKTIKKQTLHTAAAIMIIGVAASVVTTSAIRIAYQVEDGSVAEMLSLPFQQTARTVLEHGEDITQEEREAIDAVLPYDRLAELYKPSISDPVKAQMREEATRAELISYLRVWLRMFRKYPGTYICATVNQSYGLVYLPREVARVYVDYYATASKQDLIDALGEKIGLMVDPQEGAESREVLKRWYYFLFTAPVIGMLSHPAAYVIPVMITAVLGVRKKKYRYLVMLLPLLLSVGIIILAPTFQTHPRYAFPIIYPFPVLLSYYIYSEALTAQKADEAA